LAPWCHWYTTSYARSHTAICAIPVPAVGYSIQFFSFATGKVTLITKIGKPFLGLSVSPDRKWILYSQLDQRSSDVMLVENFR